MRPPGTVLRAGLSATAAVLLLTACGGSDEEPDATATSAPAASSSAAATESTVTSDEEVQAFCTEAEAVFTRVGNAFDSVTDPAAFGPVLDQGVAAFDEVRPPAEISSDWSALQQGIARLRDAVAGEDLSTPEGQTALQEAVARFQTEATEPQQNLEQYVTANCDNAATGSPSAAPSS